MDWLEEKTEKLMNYIRNLTFRKAMISYIIVLSVFVWGLSYLTMTICRHWELRILEGIHWTGGKGDFIYVKEPFEEFWYDFPENTEKVKILFLDIFRKWCPFFYAFSGMIMTIFLFYKKRLARPLSILEESVEKIRKNDLDFLVSYDSRDELGSLCDSVEEMRLELIRGKDEMWRLIERQKELNAAFAHDLRTPLTVLRGYTDFLARYVPEGRVSSEKLEATLALMTEHLKRLEDYSRTMKGIRSIEEVPFLPERTSLKEIRRKIGEVVFALNQAGDVEIICCQDGEDVSVGVLADDSMIMEVLENMLSNAIRYAKERIEVISGCNEVSGELTLAVRDDGPGFSEEQLLKALKPYYKDYRAEESDEHFGIGLHICRELCRKHGGTLNVANSINGGAVVTASFQTEKLSMKQPSEAFL